MRTFTLHFTPTYASWMNQVERWFALIMQRQIRRGSFVSAKDLNAKIEAFVAAYNVKTKPSNGQPKASLSSQNSNAYVKLFTGQHTRDRPIWYAKTTLEDLDYGAAH